MKALYLCLICLVPFVFSCKTDQTIQTAGKTKPNIIFIYADDLGRGMLGVYGQQQFTTPNIDKLANGGMRFDNVYGCMYCAPARASLLTGMHDCRRADFNITKGGIWAYLDEGLSMDEITEAIHKQATPAKKGDVFLAQIARKAGYTTAQFGKLEWGFATTPQRLARHGWDYHFGFYDHNRCHGFYPPFLFENGKKVDIPGNTRMDCGLTPAKDTPENYKKRWDMTGKAVYSQTIIMDKLLAYLDDYKNRKEEKPFFMYFPSQLPHGPTSIPKVYDEIAKNKKLTQFEKEYASMVKMLDIDVGRIYAKLQKLDLLDNTIIVFSGDNGHAIYYNKAGRCNSDINVSTGEAFDDIKTRFTSLTGGDVFDGNDGMAGLKRDSWEGGTRVPLIWYWKGKIEAGQVSTQMVSNYDFLNTLAELTGQAQIESKDGRSYANTLFGNQSEARDYTVTSSKTHGPAIVTKDGWKLRYLINHDIFQLYYLPDDYGEEHEISAQYPEKVEELKASLLKACNGKWENGLGPVKISMNDYGINFKSLKKSHE